MPSSILNSDDGVISGTSGLKSSGGDDGVLVFQSKGTETARINTDKQIVAAAGTVSLPIYSTTGDTNTGIFFPAADNIGFATNGVIRGRWTTDGLCFGSDTAAANALDDYEEGTWTPSVGGNATYSVARYGLYTKIGNVVTCQFMIGITTIGTGSTALLYGFPFAAANISSVQSGHCSYYENLAVNTIYLAFYVNVNDTTAYFVGKSSSGAVVDNGIGLFGNNTSVFGQITYRVA